MFKSGGSEFDQTSSRRSSGYILLPGGPDTDQ